MTEASVPAEPGADSAAASARSATPFWLAVTIAVAFGVFFAYDVWEAIGNLVGLNVSAAELGVALTGFGVALLVVGIIVPLLVYGVAFWLGRRRGPLPQILLFVVGFAVVQVLSADIASLFELGGLDFS